jgi:hypothetical protein
MGKRSKIAGEYRVFAAEGGQRVIQRTSARNAEIYEKAGIWRREYCTRTGMLLGFRVIGVEMRKVDADLRSIQSSVTISAAEMEQNLQHSRTEGMPERMRVELIANQQAPEDAVERIRMKIRVYPQVGAAKGDILKAWPR